MALKDARILHDSPLPRHHQVRQILADIVAQGEWQPGDKIPAETDIARILGISKMTVNKAILALTAEGVFFRDIGRGTFVVRSPAAVETVDIPEPSSPRRADTTLHVITGEPAELIADNAYHCELLLAMRCAISPLKAKLILQQSRGDSYVAAWRERSSDGWLLIAPRETDVPGLHALAAAGARAVIVGASWNEVALPSIDSDNVGGIALAVRHLAELGHRDLALLYADPRSSNTQDRIRGFEAALSVHELSCRRELLLDAGMTTGIQAEVADRLMTWLRRSDRPTAFVAAGAFIAYRLLELAHEAGLDVPGDLSIVGFDDPAALSSVSPALTTVRQPLEAIGQAAIFCLEDWSQSIKNWKTAYRQRLPCELVVRGSTAGPGRAG